MTPPIPTERCVQRAILKMLRDCFPRVIYHHSPNGAHLAGGGTARFKQVGALKGDGMQSGFPDILCLWPAGKRGTLMEVKRLKGSVVSDAQVEMHERLAGAGWPVAIVRSPEEAYAHLKELGAPWSGVPFA